MNSDKEPSIKAMIVLDAIGRPPEHLVETLKNIAIQIDNEKGIQVKSKKIKKPELMKEQKNFYTTFAEIEIEAKEMMYLMVIMFKYMPAHVEIISPEIVAITNNSWNELLNELARRLHGYDEIARVMQVENKKLQQKISELTGGILQPSPTPTASPFQAQQMQQTQKQVKNPVKKLKKKSKKSTKKKPGKKNKKKNSKKKSKPEKSSKKKK